MQGLSGTFQGIQTGSSRVSGVSGNHLKCLGSSIHLSSIQQKWLDLDHRWIFSISVEICTKKKQLTSSRIAVHTNYWTLGRLAFWTVFEGYFLGQSFLEEQTLSHSKQFRWKITHYVALMLPGWAQSFALDNIEEYVGILSST